MRSQLHAGTGAAGHDKMTYAEFRPRYLRAHACPRTRALHFLGTGLAVLCLGLGAVWRDCRFLFAAPIVGYAFAWVSHVAIERNRPATFGHPVWSLLSDFRMFGLFVTRRLRAHLIRAGLP